MSFPGTPFFLDEIEIDSGLIPSENKTIEDGGITVEVWIIVAGWWKQPADTRVGRGLSKVIKNGDEEYKDLGFK